MTYSSRPLPAGNRAAEPSKVHLLPLCESGLGARLDAVTTARRDKTTPTNRDEITAFEDNWQQFRSFLRRRHQLHFDRLVEHAHNFADAGGA